MKVWILLLSAAIGSQLAFAESSRVLGAIDESNSTIASMIVEKKAQLLDVQAKVTELQSQLNLARKSGNSDGVVKIKKVFIVTAVASAAALTYGIATTKSSGGYIALPIFGRGTFIGLLGLVASGVGYMATDSVDLSLSYVEDQKLSRQLARAQDDLVNLAVALAKLESQTK